MSEGQSGVFGELVGSAHDIACSAARQVGCSLRTAAAGAASEINGLKESRTNSETEIFLSLARGHRIAVRDHETGALWR